MTDPNILRRLLGLERAYEQTRTKEVITYTTGTWTPSYYGATTAGTTTYQAGFPVGSYVRLGSTVIVTGTVIWTAATGTGDARIGLPFTSVNTTNQFFSGGVWTSNVTFANGPPQILLFPNTNYFVLQSPQSNAGSTTVAVEATGNVVFTITYFI